MLRVRPSIWAPCRPSLAASACSAVTIFTNPKPRDSLVCGSNMIEQLSTSPYLSKSAVTSCSLSLGWMPVTKRLVPVLTASFSGSSMRVSVGGGGLSQVSEVSRSGRWLLTERDHLEIDLVVGHLDHRAHLAEMRIDLVARNLYLLLTISAAWKIEAVMSRTIIRRIGVLKVGHCASILFVKLERDEMRIKLPLVPREQ